MSLFKKKESTHFERNEAGEVIQTTRNGQQVDPEELKMKSSRQLEQEYYSKHPERRHPTLTKIGRGAAVLDKKIVAYNRRSNIMNPQRTTQRRSVSFTSNPPSRSNANPFGNMFDTGMPKIKKKKSSSSKVQYKIINNKAYPIAGTGSSKKKKSTRRRASGGYDMMDNWGFMK